MDQLERPLFSLFVCDAWCSGKDVRNWHRDDALEVTAAKEYEKALDYIKLEYNKKSEQNNVLNAVKSVISFSAFVNLLDIHQIHDYLFQYHRVDCEEDSFQWILQQLGFIEEGKILKVYPDLLNEYISLRYINTLTRRQAIDFFTCAFSNADRKTFRNGCTICEDYADLLDAPSNMSIMPSLEEKGEARIGEEISAGLSENEIEEFDNITDEKIAEDWLDQHCPDYGDIVVRISEEMPQFFLGNQSKIFCYVEKEMSSGIYSGETVFDWRCGKGKQVYNDGTVFDGDWNMDSPNGVGKMIWPDGTTYDGYWKDGDRDGQGVLNYASGARFEGEWKKDKRHYGKILLSDGALYFGGFKNGEFHGNGEMNFVDGCKFVGEFRDGMRFRGEFTSIKGWKYQGEWKEHSPHGNGKIIFVDGSSYVGEWRDGERHGKGVFTSSSGEVKKGLWENDQLLETE